jgi:hypothetical protein
MVRYQQNHLGSHILFLVWDFTPTLADDPIHRKNNTDCYKQINRCIVAPGGTGNAWTLIHEVLACQGDRMRAQQVGADPMGMSGRASRKGGLSTVCYQFYFVSPPHSPTTIKVLGNTCFCLKFNIMEIPKEMNGWLNTRQSIWQFVVAIR